MDKYRVLEIKESVFESNDREAEKLRGELKQEKTFLLNLMSSPGSGKTTTLMATIEALKDDLRIGVMEADIDSDVDAATISTSGVKVIQLHTGGMCHLDAGMTRQGLEGLGTEDVDLAILENIGNLVCPAEFDTGAGGRRQAPQVPAHVLDLRRAAREQDRRGPVLQLQPREVHRARPQAQPEHEGLPDLRAQERGHRALGAVAERRGQGLAGELK